MKKKNWQGQNITKIKVERNDVPPIGIDIIEALQPFIQFVPAKELSLFIRILTKSFAKKGMNEQNAKLFAANIKHVKRLQIFLIYIDHFYDQSELKINDHSKLPGDENHTRNQP